MSNYKTAESVSPKHPDKLCDQISDAILDAYLKEDPNSRVAIDVAGGHKRLFVTGEITSAAKNVDIAGIVKRLAGNVMLTTSLSSQSPEIAQGVDIGGAGDQGVMVGFATGETKELLPLEVVLSRQLNQYLYSIWPFDGKTQITLKNGLITSAVASFQNAPGKELNDAVNDWIDKQTAKRHDREFKLFANPAGDWQIGGFDADSGLTGRKLVVDNYGPRVPIGGGAFSGKDPSKVDRSAAYIARKIAIDLIRKHKAREVYVHLAYAIGYDQPLEATATIDNKQIKITGYDLSPNGIINFLDLKRPIYEPTARYGHFGHGEFAWEA